MKKENLKIIKDVAEFGIGKGTKIVGVFPHPDDETVFCGGFLYKCACARANVVALMLSDGENGKSIVPIEREKTLAQVRNAELACAAEILGIRRIEYGHFPDGSISANDDKAIEMLSRIVDVENPDFIIVYEPFGVYGHTDHITASHIATKVCEKRKSETKIIYVTVGEKFIASPGVSLLSLIKGSPMRANIVVELSEEEIKKKTEALKCHRSQFHVDDNFISKWSARDMVDKEYFVI